jgi:hypothetical protein
MDVDQRNHQGLKRSNRYNHEDGNQTRIDFPIVDDETMQYA